MLITEHESRKKLVYWELLLILQKISIKKGKNKKFFQGCYLPRPIVVFLMLNLSKVKKIELVTLVEL